MNCRVFFFAILVFETRMHVVPTAHATRFYSVRSPRSRFRGVPPRNGRGQHIYTCVCAHSYNIYLCNDIYVYSRVRGRVLKMHFADKLLDKLPPGTWRARASSGCACMRIICMMRNYILHVEKLCKTVSQRYERHPNIFDTAADSSDQTWTTHAILRRFHVYNHNNTARYTFGISLDHHSRATFNAGVIGGSCLWVANFMVFKECPFFLRGRIKRRC